VLASVPTLMNATFFEASFLSFIENFGKQITEQTPEVFLEGVHRTLTEHT